MQLVEAVRIDPEVYVPSDISDQVESPKIFAPAVPVLPIFLDLPLITGDEVPYAPHLALGAQPWPGSVAVYQAPGESNFRLLDLFSTRSIMGTTETELQKGPVGRYDNGAVVVVKLMSGSLSSVDEQALLSGANLAAIGDGTNSNWEVFQFRDAELIAPDTYRLTTRLRGQLGSDGLMPEVWPAGSSFVLLNGLPEQISLSRNLRRVAQTYRIGPARRSVSDPSYVEVVEAFDGNGLRPYAPVHLQTDTGADGAVTVKWTRRTRVDGDNWDVADVPLGEESESYLVRVLKDDVVVREDTVEDPIWIYPLSAQAADGLTGTVDIHVAQNSAVFGPGLFARTVISV